MDYIKELETLSEEDRIKSLRTNKDAILEAKKASIKETDAISFKPIAATREVKSAASKKAGTKASDQEEDSGSLEVTVVCNTAWFCDDQMDVITDAAYSDSIAAKGSSIPHIRDHQRSCVAHVADVQKVYTKTFTLQELGYSGEGSTTALCMDSTIKASYDQKVFDFYKNGKINQHSIGMRYQELSIAINSNYEDDKKEKEVWDKYYPSVINKELVDKRGYFWVAEKIDIIENSCVLFGSNPLTPTLSMKSFEVGSEKTVSGDPKPEDIVKQTSKGDNMADKTAETLVALQAEVETLKASQQLEVAKAVKVETGRVVAILKAGETFGIKSSVVANAIEKGYPLEVVTDMFTTIAENTDSASAVKTGASSTSSADASQVAAMKAAKEAEVGDDTFDGMIQKALKAEGGVNPNTLFKGIG